MQFKSVLTVAASLLLSHSTLAVAESDALQAIRASAATIATNHPGIHTYAEAPAGFDPMKASELQLAFYGFPPRPDPEADAHRYTSWARAMRAAKIRWNGELKPLPGGRPMTMPAASSPEAETAKAGSSGPQKISTINASGVILNNKEKSYNKKNSFVYAYAEFIVPNALLPFNTTSCAASDYTEVTYVGIDGSVSNTGNGNQFDPMLEGGVYASAPCGGTPFYYAELAWQDDLQGVFPVTPGDVMNVGVVALPGQSYVYLGDLTTQTYKSYTVSSPGIVGNSAAWIVETLCCTGNQPFPLANTLSIAFGDAAVQTGSQFDTKNGSNPGSQASSTKILTMTNYAGDQDIETVDQGSAGTEGLQGLWFQTLGCALINGC
jgi:hypothetical protein